MCAGECPVTAIKGGAEKHEINPQICIDCGACAAICPANAISPAKAPAKPAAAPALVPAKAAPIAKPKK